MIVFDKKSQPLQVGDIVQQKIWDGGDAIPDEHLPRPRRIERLGVHRLIMVEGARDWQASSQFEKVTE